MKKLMRYLKQEDGIVAIEYGLIAVAIAVAIAATVWLIGDRILAIFQAILTALR